MKKITLLIALMITSLGFAQQNFPFTFESGPTAFTDFDLAVTTQVANPDPTGINTSATVAKIVRGAAGYSGTKITVAAPIDFTVNKIIKMKVWFPVAGQSMIMKFEDLGAIPGDFEKSIANVPAMVWTEVSFDYQGVSNNTRDQLVFLFNPGVAGDGTANSTYYFDDITFSPPTVVYDPIVLPLDFENSNQNFVFGNFPCDAVAMMTKVANPDPTGNPSANCLKMVKGGVACGPLPDGNPVWAGISFIMSSPLNLSLGKFFKMKVWSPKSGSTVTLKFEDGQAPTFDLTSGPLVMGWQTVTFDGSVLDNARSYNKLVLFNELGNVGDGTANFTYYYDDITQHLTLSTAKFDTSSIKMYPNPVKNSLTIDANSSIQKVSVYNILGQEVLSVSPKSNSATLQTGSLQKGAYMVRTEIDGNVSTSKIIKE